MQPNMQEAFITHRPNSFSVDWILYVAGTHPYSYHRRLPGTVTHVQYLCKNFYKKKHVKESNSIHMLPTKHWGKENPYICFLVVWTSIEISEYNIQLSIYRHVKYTYIPLWNQVTETRTASTQNTDIYQGVR